MKPGGQRAVFLDRDGVIIEDTNYVGAVEQVRIIPGALQAIKRFQDAGYRLFVVTNQSGVARGYFTTETVQQIHAHLDAALAEIGAKIDRYYVCPHHPDERCACRKPQPKFLFDAAATYGLDLAQCYMIGDRPSDIATGRNAGTRTILVLTGAGRETCERGDVRADHVAADLAAAAEWILSQ